MTAAVVWLVVWGILMLANFYLGVIGLWATLVERVFNKGTGRKGQARGVVPISLGLLLISAVSAVFFALQIVSVVQLATA